jgi:hypothetical protein
MNAAETNLAAEVRAVEEGHHAFDLGGDRFRVVSDTVDGKAYMVSTSAFRAGDLVQFTCSPEEVRGADHGPRHTANPGVTGCKHAALVARRLEREGVVVVDRRGMWQATRPVGAAAAAVAELPSNPLEGLPT